MQPKLDKIDSSKKSTATDYSKSETHFWVSVMSRGRRAENIRALKGR